MPSSSVSLAAIRQPAFLYDAGGRIAEANDRAESLAGRSLAGSTPAAVVGIFDVRSQDGTPLMPAGLPASRALRGEEAIDVPLVVTAADGRTLHVLATAAPIRNGDEVVGAFSIWQDISVRERMRAEAETAAEELRVQQEELRQLGEELVRAVSDLDRQQRLLDGILGALPHHVSLWDRNERLVWANECFAAVLGEPREALVGRTWRELWGDVPEIAPLVEGALQSVAAGMPSTRELEAAGSAGPGWRAVTFLPIFGDQVLVIAEDVTERKRMEEELRKSEAEFRHIVEYAPTGIYEIDYAGPRFRRVNEAMCRILGYTREELLAMNPADLLDAESQARFRKRVRTVLAGAPIDQTVAFRVFGKGGREFWCALEVKPTYTDGRMDGALVVAHDITERKEMEEQLERSNRRVTEILASIREHFYVIDRDWNFTYANRQFASKIGKEPGDFVGRNLWEMFPKHAGTPYEENLRAAMERREVRRFEVGGKYTDEQYQLAVFPSAEGITVLGTEVTGQKRVEAALRESEARLAAVAAAAVERERLFEVLEAIPLSVCLLTREYHVAFANRSFRETFGESEGRHCYEYCFGRSEPCPFCESFRVFETGRPHRWEVSMPDGRIIEANDFPFTDVDGTPMVLELDLDVTEQRRMEAALREANVRLEERVRERTAELEGTNSRLEAIIETVPVGLFITGADGRVVVTNEEAERIWAGTVPLDSVDESAGYVGYWPDSGDPLGAEDWSAAQAVLHGRATLGVEVDILRFDGTRGTILSSGVPIRENDGSIAGAVVAVLDITERKRAEEVLRETRDYLDSLIDHANAPIVVWDPAFRITRFNAAFEHLSGYAADEVMGRDLVVLFPEEGRKESLAKIQRTITERWESVEIPILRPDGGVRIALWNSANIYDPSGTILLATIAQGQDITDRIAAEAALREHAESLRRSNEDLERFAYVASHDLQEPLRSIVSFSQLLERRYRGKLGPDADEYIEFIVEGGSRMQGLILDLLAFSRVNTTRQQIARTDAEDVLAEAERALDASLREADATLTHDPLPVVMADPTQLAQVFANLISNAVKFRKPDVPLRVHVGVRRLDGVWEFSVADNGIGIEKEYYDRIFVIFQRLHTKDTYPGTGIGLAIVKRIIDRHGGTIRVESMPGEGTTFVFTLPAA